VDHWARHISYSDAFQHTRCHTNNYTDTIHHTDLNAHLDSYRDNNTRSNAHNHGELPSR